MKSYIPGINRIFRQEWLPAVGILLFLILANHGFSQTTYEKWKAGQKTLLEDKGLVVYYDFEQAPDTILKNKSKAGKVLDADIMNAEWEQGRWPGKKAVRFDGKSSLVEIPAHEKLFSVGKPRGSTGEMTIEAWIKAAALSHTCAIWDKSSKGDSTSAPYMLWLSPDHLAAYLGGRPADKVNMAGDSSPFEAGKWLHVAVTVDEQHFSIYRDGKKVGSDLRKPEQGEISDNGEPLLIGAASHQSLFFDGWMDEFSFYNRALDETEILQHATQGPKAD